MTKSVNHISLKKSAASGKAPQSTDLVQGELAVNIAKGTEKIYLKNSNKEVIGFSPDGTHLPLSGGTVSGNTEFKGDVKIVYPDSSSTTVSLREMMVDNEMAISAALNDLNTRIEDQKTIVDADSKLIGNITTEIKGLLPLSGGTVTGETAFTNNTTFDNLKLKYPTASSEAVSLRDVMVENEKVTAAALNDLNERVNDQKSDIDTIKAKEYLPLSGGTIDGHVDFIKDINVAGEGGIISSIVTTNTLTSDDELNIHTVRGITHLEYDEGEEVNVWTTDGKTKPLSEFLLTSGGTVSGETIFTKDVKVVFPNSGTPTSLVGAIVDNEKVTAAALNDLNDKFDKCLPSSGGTVSGPLYISNDNLYIIDNQGNKYRLELGQLLNQNCITKV